MTASFFHQPDPDRSENPADELTRAIASNRAFIDAHWDWHSGRDNTQGTAEAVLNTPEMQAIKQALLCFANNVSEDWGLPSARAVLEVIDGCCLQPSVVQWVIS